MGGASDDTGTDGDTSRVPSSSRARGGSMLYPFENVFDRTIMLGGSADSGAAGVWAAWIGDAAIYRGLDSVERPSRVFVQSV